MPRVPLPAWEGRGTAAAQPLCDAGGPREGGRVRARGDEEGGEGGGEEGPDECAASRLRRPL